MKKKNNALKNKVWISEAKSEFYNKVAEAKRTIYNYLINVIDAVYDDVDKRKILEARIQEYLAKKEQQKVSINTITIAKNIGLPRTIINALKNVDLTYDLTKGEMKIKDGYLDVKLRVRKYK